MVREIDTVYQYLVPIGANIRRLDQHVSFSGWHAIDPKFSLAGLVSDERNVGGGYAGVPWAKELVEPYYCEIPVQSHCDVPF